MYLVEARWSVARLQDEFSLRVLFRVVIVVTTVVASKGPVLTRFVCEMLHI
jgi:hypothetical protein